MARPTKAVRAGVYERDGFSCVSCGREDGLSFQHRRATGMRGGGAPVLSDGLTACVVCNMRFESDLQDDALAYGWKVRSWVVDPARIPYYHAATDRWYVLNDDAPTRREVTFGEAVSMMLAVYGPDWRPR